MTIALEYIICQYTEGSKSYAIKSHRVRNQNPGLDVVVDRNEVRWELCGLSDGTVEQADPENSSATRLDFYIAKGEFLKQRRLLPRPAQSHNLRGLRLTNPTGSERRGGKHICWVGPLHKLQMRGSEMFFPAAHCLLLSGEPSINLNIDWERSKYPLPDGSHIELHFGVETAWDARPNRRRKIPRATIRMSVQEYANLYSLLRRIH